MCYDMRKAENHCADVLMLQGTQSETAVRPTRTPLVLEEHTVSVLTEIAAMAGELRRLKL